MFTYFFVRLFTSTYNFALRYKPEVFMPEKTHRLIFFVMVFAGGRLCYWLLSQNRFIYLWDYGNFWTQSFSQMHILFSSSLLAIFSTGTTILYC